MIEGVTKRGEQGGGGGGGQTLLMAAHFGPGKLASGCKVRR